MERLRNQCDRVADEVAEFNRLRDELDQKVSDLKSTLRHINSKKKALGKVVDEFDEFSNEFQKAAEENEFGKEVNQMAVDLKAEYELVKWHNERAMILSSFYDQIHADNEQDGLNETEFEYLKYALEENVRAQFPDFDEFNQDGDGLVTYDEFVMKLNEIYKDRLEALQFSKGHLPRHVSNAISGTQETPM